jgi:hypothetical protein
MLADFDIAWWSLVVLVVLGWYWVLALTLGFLRLRRLLREYEEERWGEKTRK